MSTATDISTEDTSTSKTTAADFHKAPPSLRKEFFSFLKTLRSFTGDLSSISAPSFVLAPLSLIEHPSFLLETPQLLLAPGFEPDPSLRALKVLHFYLGSLFSQFGTISPPTSIDNTFLKRDKRKKKPLNPFLGELFIGHVEDPSDRPDSVSRTNIVCEQVSHHPPVTAYRIWNDQAGVMLEGYNAQRTYFSGTIRMERIGHWLVHFRDYDEDWVVTLPRVHLEGLIPPPPKPELDGTTRLASSNSYTIELQFSGKGWLRGKRNSFVAEVNRGTLFARKPVYTVEGQWCGGKYEVKDALGTVIETVDTLTARNPARLVVNPIDEQDPLESRRAWELVIRGIESGDMNLVSSEKNKLEEEQRALRRKEEQDGTEWQMRYFEKVPKWAKAEKLLAVIGTKVEDERTKGVWRWKEGRAEGGEEQQNGTTEDS